MRENPLDFLVLAASLHLCKDRADVAKLLSQVTLVTELWLQIPPSSRLGAEKSPLTLTLHPKGSTN